MGGIEIDLGHVLVTCYPCQDTKVLAFTRLNDVVMQPMYEEDGYWDFPDVEEAVGRSDENGNRWRGKEWT